jgi:hypothetical protein
MVDLLEVLKMEGDYKSNINKQIPKWKNSERNFSKILRGV